MSAFYDQASLVVVPSGYKSGKIYAQKPLTTDGQLTFTRASTATRVNASGLIEAVASGVPRLDYTDSTCPKLLLEPQRTNLIFPSEDFSNVNFADTNLTVTTNQAISPDGNQNADKFTTASTTAECQVRYSNFSVASNVGSAVTTTVYAKKGTANFLRIRNLFVQDGATFGNAWFNIDNGTVSSVQSSQIARITDAGNGYYRCSLTGIVGTVPLNIIDIGITNTNGVNFPTTAVDAFIWGAQLELGAYATSYVKTEAAAVTRLADAASKTGISSLIGQTEGTLFIDTQVGDETDEVYGWLQASLSGNPNDSIQINRANTAVQCQVYTGSSVTGLITGGSITTGQRIKIAVGYKQNDVVLYLNGTQIGIDTSTNIPTCAVFQLGAYPPLLSDYTNNGGIKQALLFKTRLTNAQLAELTTL
jgi:hypothetical protein